MRRAADTAARIASRGDKGPPIDVMHYESADYYRPEASTVAVAAADKVELIRRADRAARARTIRASPALTSTSSTS